MRRLIAGLLLLTAACHTPAAPDAPAALVATREIGEMALFSAAAVDTLPYVLSWTPGKLAKGYEVTTTTPDSGWSGLLAQVPTTSTSIAFRPIHTADWDSVSFTACVVSTAPGKAPSDPTCISWKLVRGPAPPGGVTVDSSLIIAEFLQLPHDRGGPPVVTQVNVPVKLCPYFRALDGKVRLVDGYNGSYCCQMYVDSFPPTERLPGCPVQYEVAAGSYQWGPLRLVTRTPQAQLAHELFKGPFG